jgi:hypothetical protein
MKKIGFILVLCLLFCRCNMFGQAIPASRTVNWKVAGLNDSIPQPKNVIDFSKAGGVADGKTPNDAVWNKIIDSLNGKSAAVYFPKGSYFFKEPFNLSSGMAIQGYSSDSSILIFHLNKEDHLIKIQGKATELTYHASGNLLKDDSGLIFNHPKTLSAGDYIRINDNDSALITSSWARLSTGQILKIENVNDSIVFFSDHLRRNYNTASASMVKITPVQNVVIKDLKIIRTDSTIAQTSNIYFEYAANCMVKCIESINCNFAHVELNNSTNILVAGSYFHKAFNYGDGGKGYGVVAHFNTGACLVSDNNFDSLRHAMLVQAGANGNVFSYNYSRHPVWKEAGFPVNASGDIVLHGNHPYANLFEGNVVQNIIIDNSHGANGPYNTFFRNRLESYGLSMSFNAANNQNFEGNEITNSAPFMGGFTLTGANQFLYANNKNGTVIPSGTDNLQQASLYLDQIPHYYKLKASWPPVGLPNKLNQYPIQAEEYFVKGFFTICSYIAPVVDTTTKDTTGKDTTNSAICCNTNSRQGISVFPNPANTFIQIRITPGTNLRIKDIIVFTALGRQILEEGPADTINISALPDGIYFINFRLSDGSTRQSKFLKISR